MLAGPGLQIGGSLQIVVHECVEEVVGGDGGEGLVDACGSLLIGKLDDVSRARVELAAVARGLVFGCPGHRILPDEACAPGVVAHDDDGCGVPLVVLFEELAHVGEVAVGQREIVDVGGVPGAEGFFAAVVEAVGVRDGHVQEEKVDGGVGEVDVARGEEIAVVGGVLTDVAGLVGGCTRAAAEEVFGVEPETAEGAEEIDRERAVRR